jgi:tetratricopeptide (TPR) repeat protein
MLIGPLAPARADSPVNAQLEALSNDGRWEQILVVTDGLKPLPADLEPYRDRAERELRNLTAFLRLRNAVKRKDYGTALLVGQRIEDDSVYAARTRRYLAKARRHYGEKAVGIARLHPDRAAAELELVLQIDPDNKAVKRELARLERQQEHALKATTRGAQGEEAPAQAVAELEFAEEDSVVAEVDNETEEISTPRAGPSADGTESLSLEELTREIHIKKEVHEIHRVDRLDGPSLETYLAADAAMADMDTPKAAALFDEVTRHNPSFAAAHLRLGLARYATGDMVGASAAFTTYLDLVPDDPRASQLHTFIAQHSGADGGAVAPRNAARALLTEAHKSLAAGNPEGALAWLLRATQRDPSFPEPYLQLGLLQERNGRRDLAVAAYETYLGLAPDGAHAPAVRETLTRLNSITRSDVF